MHRRKEEEEESLSLLPLPLYILLLEKGSMQESQNFEILEKKYIPHHFIERINPLQS
jgi:hypothetical protein